MKIIGICGAIHSGKSTFAELLTGIKPDQSLHLETSQVIVDLANTFNRTLSTVPRQNDTAVLAAAVQPLDSLRPAISTMVGRMITPEELAIDPNDVKLNPQWYDKLFQYFESVRIQPELLKETITAENKDNYRPLLQWIGGYVLYRLNNPLLWYQELLRRVADAGTNIDLVALTAPRQPSEAEFVRQQAGGKVIKLIRPDLQSDTSDVTEKQAAAIRADSEIINDGTLDDLAAVTKMVYGDIMHGRLKAVYEAKA